MTLENVGSLLTRKDDKDTVSWSGIINPENCPDPESRWSDSDPSSRPDGGVGMKDCSNFDGYDCLFIFFFNFVTQEYGTQKKMTIFPEVLIRRRPDKK